MLRLLWLVLLVVLFSPFSFCVDAAIATASGAVTLNGKTLVHSSAVFPGDTLAIATGSALVLQGKSYSIQAGPNAIVSVQEHSLWLTSGAARVTGTAIITANDITIAGDSVKAKFVVAKDGDVVCLTVQQGAVVLRRQEGETRVGAGQTRIFNQAPESQKKRSFGLATIGGTGVGIAGLVAGHLEDANPRCISNCGMFSLR